MRKLCSIALCGVLALGACSETVLEVTSGDEPSSQAAASPPPDLPEGALYASWLPPGWSYSHMQTMDMEVGLDHDLRYYEGTPNFEEERPANLIVSTLLVYPEKSLESAFTGL